jgi:hypothetical protein
MKPTLIIAIIVVVIVFGGALYAYMNPQIATELGLRHAPMQSGTASTTPNQDGTHSFNGARGGFVMGSIEVLNDNGFTVTLSDGTTKDINLTATTTLLNYATASSTPATITPDQLSVGEQVFVIGTPAADGSITATRVMTGTLPARPAGGFGSGGRHGTSSAQAPAQ